MKRKKMLLALIAAAVLVVPFSVFAATSDAPVAKTVRGFFGIDVSKLTDQQKADVNDYTQKMADLQKDFVNKMVDNGALTREQGDAQIERIDNMLKNGGENGFLWGFGMGKGGHGRPGGFGLGQIDTSKLTDEQKASLTETYIKMADLQKELVNKMVSDGLLTQEQGDAAIEKIDEISKDTQENGLFKGKGMMMGGLNFFGLKGIDTSKLTDQQKADLTDFSKKMTDLQKEVINKMVSYGLMTAEQGDTAVERLDALEKYREENGFFNGKGMGKGRFGNPGKQEDSSESSSKAPTT